MHSLLSAKHQRGFCVATWKSSPGHLQVHPRPRGHLGWDSRGTVQTLPGGLERGSTSEAEFGGWGASPELELLGGNVQGRNPALTNAGRVVLGEARRALAVEAPDDVDTEELAVVLLGGTLVQV